MSPDDREELIERTLSNGSKALHFAGEHIDNLEKEVAGLRARVATAERELAREQGRTEEQATLIAKLETEKNIAWSQANTMAQIIVDTQSLLVEGVRKANDILKEQKL